MSGAQRFTRRFSPAQREAIIKSVFEEGRTAAATRKLAKEGSLGVPAFDPGDYTYQIVLKERVRRREELQDPSTDIENVNAAYRIEQQENERLQQENERLRQIIADLCDPKPGCWQAALAAGRAVRDDPGPRTPPPRS